MAPNRNYWRKRSEILENRNIRKAESVQKELEQQFTIAQRKIEEQIDQWYGRFAKNNQISLTEARQWLSGKDLAEFKWDVEEYIKHGKSVALNPEYIKQLENASVRFHISRLEALKLRTQDTLENLYGNMKTKSSSLFGQIYQDNYYHTAFEIQKGFNIGFDIAAVNEAKVKSVLSKPWTLDGDTFSDRIWTQKQILLNEVHTRLTQNFMLGQSPDEAIKAIANKFGTSRANAGRLVMTESAYFASIAQKEAYNELEVEEFEIVGTLDGDMCDICAPLDGTHYPMPQFETGVTAPPFHPNCRCTTCPYFADLGGSRWARDPETGEGVYIPSDMTYTDWKEKFVDKGDKSLTNPPDSGIMDVGGGDMGKNSKLPRITEIAASKITEKINSGEYSTKLSRQQYLRHVSGTVEYNDYMRIRQEKGQPPQSILTITEQEAQELIKQKAGTGIVKVSKNGEMLPEEAISISEIIGKTYSGSTLIETNKAKIFYGKHSSHIVPIGGMNYD